MPQQESFPLCPRGGCLGQDFYNYHKLSDESKSSMFNKEVLNNVYPTSYYNIYTSSRFFKQMKGCSAKISAKELATTKCRSTLDPIFLLSEPESFLLEQSCSQAQTTTDMYNNLPSRPVEEVWPNYRLAHRLRVNEYSPLRPYDVSFEQIRQNVSPLGYSMDENLPNLHVDTVQEQSPGQQLSNPHSLTGIAPTMSPRAKLLTHQ